MFWLLKLSIFLLVLLVFGWVFSSNCIFCSCLNLLSMSNFVFWLLNLQLWSFALQLSFFLLVLLVLLVEQKCCFAFCFQIWLIVILVCRFELIVSYCWVLKVVTFFVMNNSFEYWFQVSKSAVSFLLCQGLIV